MLIRTHGISEAWIAFGGAFALLATGAVDLVALPASVGESADVLLFSLGIMALAGQITVQQAIDGFSWAMGVVVIARTIPVGGNIGPALATYVALATMLWPSLILPNGIDVAAGGYRRVSLVTMPVVLVTTSLALVLQGARGRAVTPNRTPT